MQQTFYSTGLRGWVEKSICGYQVEGKRTNECSLPEVVSGETSDQLSAQKCWLRQTLLSMRSIVNDSGFGNRYTITFSVTGNFNYWENPRSKGYFHTPDQVSMDLNTDSTWALKTISFDLTKVKSNRIFVVSPDGMVFESCNSFIAVGKQRLTYQVLEPNHVAAMCVEIKATDPYGNVTNQAYTYQMA